MLALAGDHKPIALAEVGTMPTLEILARQPRWTYMMMWSGSAEGSNTPAQLQTIFHAPNIVDRGDPRLSVPIVAPPGPVAPVDIGATSAARAMLAKFSSASSAGNALSPGASQNLPDVPIVEIAVADATATDIIERVRAARGAAQLPLLRWTPLSPTGKDGAALDDFEWSELRHAGTSLHSQWQGEVEQFARLLESLQKQDLPVLVSAMPEANSDAQWWSAHPGPEGYQALLRDVQQSLEAHHLHNIVSVWEVSLSGPDRTGARRGLPIGDFFPGPLSADLILIDQPNDVSIQGWTMRMAREFAGPKPLGVRTSSAKDVSVGSFDFVVTPSSGAPRATNASFIQKH